MSASGYEGYSETRFAHDPRRAAVWGEIAAYLQRYVPRDRPLLDLGSGYCDFVNAIEATPRYALDRFIDPATYADSGVVPLQADAADLSGVAEPLQTVFSSNLLEHLTPEHGAEVARAVREALAPGGRWLLLQPKCFHRAFPPIGTMVDSRKRRLPESRHPGPAR